MYLFSIVAIPLGFLLLTFLVYPREEISGAGRAVARGLICAVPVWVVARLLGALVPEIWGSPLLALREFFDRFLPYGALPALAYAVFYHYGERLQPGEEQRRLTAFYAGVLAPFGLGEMVRLWGHPDVYSVLVLPFIVAALILAMPTFALAFMREYGARRILPSGVAFFFCAVASFVRPLFLARLWPLALLAAGGLAAAAWFIGFAALDRRPSRRDAA